VVLTLFSACSSVLKFLPGVTKSAILFNAAIGLIEVHEIHFLFKSQSKKDIFLFLSTWVICFFISIGDGILLCLLLASFLILRRTTALHINLMGEVTLPSGTKAYVDVVDNPEAKLVDDVLLLQLKGDLEFFNAARMRRRIEILLDLEEQISNNEIDTQLAKRKSLFFVKASQRENFSIVMDFSSCSNIDTASLLTLHEVTTAYQRHGTRFIVCGLHPIQKLMFEKAGLINAIGKENIVPNMASAVVVSRGGINHGFRDASLPTGLKKVYERNGFRFH
jgi:sulfate permease, SulP family